MGSRTITGLALVAFALGAAGCGPSAAERDRAADFPPDSCVVIVGNESVDTEVSITRVPCEAPHTHVVVSVQRDDQPCPSGADPESRFGLCVRSASPSDSLPDTFDGEIFSGVFVASQEAVDAWAIEAGITPGSWPAVQFKRLSSVELGTLESVLTGVSYDDIDQNELHKIVRKGSEDGPWIAPVRRQLVDALASIEGPQVEHVAAAWASTDEMILDRVTKDDLVPALRDMSRLARTSLVRGDPMFLIMSL